MSHIKSMEDHNDNSNSNTQTIEESQAKVEEPSLYKVLLLNDDFTPMDFVVDLLKKLFHHSETKAMEIMMQVHNQGAGVAGVFDFETAETKMHIANQTAQKHEFPLKCTIEKE